MDKSLIVLCGSIFAAGLIGSWHCGVMCGPMACFLAAQKQLKSYQLGRMLSYTLAGASSGQIMSLFFESYSCLKYTSVIGLSVMLIVMAFNTHKQLKTPDAFTSMYKKFQKSGFLLGFFSFLLPCGWLWTFIVSAAATRSAYAGALVMFIFWCSTVPALTTAQIVLKKMIEKAPLKTQQISSIVLLFASLYSLATFWFLHS